MKYKKLTHGLVPSRRASLRREVLFSRFLCMSFLYFIYLWAPVPAVSQTQKGIASYYGKQATGRRTSNGERLHHDSLTCAHRTFPFGTLLKVTNPANNRVVVVRVTDRGPFGRGRIIDLSWGAAKQLGILSQGIASVVVERIGSTSIPMKDTTQVKLPELELAVPVPIVGMRPVWQDSLSVSHKEIHHKAEQTAKNSWIESLKNFFSR